MSQEPYTEEDAFDPSIVGALSDIVDHPTDAPDIWVMLPNALVRGTAVTLQQFNTYFPEENAPALHWYSNSTTPLTEGVWAIEHSVNVRREAICLMNCDVYMHGACFHLRHLAVHVKDIVAWGDDSGADSVESVGSLSSTK